MLKLELLLRRIRGFDVKRMMVYVRDVKKETKTPTPVIMADMLYCILRYNVGFYDYHIFGFAHIHGAKARSTFFTMQDNWRLTRMVNSPEDRPYFENKLLFCRTFAPYLGCCVAMGYVPVEDAEIGKHVYADVRGRKIEMEIVPTPFYKR